MEQFDILDKTGCKTGLVANKGAQLAQWQYYLGVHVYVYNHAKEFLVQQRAYDRRNKPRGFRV